MKIVMAKTATDSLRDKAPGNAMEAARQAVQILAHRTGATGGLILLDRDGNPGWAFNTPRMSFGYVESDGTLVLDV